MRVEHLTETVPRELNLSEQEAAALAAAGKRLAGSGEFWRHTSTDADSLAERSVIRCDQVAPGRYRVAVREAVGIVALSSLQVVVAPKIPSAHFRHLLQRSPAFPRLDDHQAFAAESSELWDLVAAWFVTALERLLRRGLVADYEEHRGDLPYLRGSARAFETASGYYQGRLAFRCVFDEFGLDSPMNRVLRAAAAAVASASVLKPGLRRRARNALTRLAEVGELRPGDVYSSPERRSAHYAISLQLARHVLAATGRTVAAGPAPAWTFLIRTPELIEDAVRAILWRGLRDLVEVSHSGIGRTSTRQSLSQPDIA